MSIFMNCNYCNYLEAKSNHQGPNKVLHADVCPNILTTLFKWDWRDEQDKK